MHAGSRFCRVVLSFSENVGVRGRWLFPDERKRKCKSLRCIRISDVSDTKELVASDFVSNEINRRSLNDFVARRCRSRWNLTFRDSLERISLAARVKKNSRLQREHGAYLRLNGKFLNRPGNLHGDAASSMASLAWKEKPRARQGECRSCLIWLNLFFRSLASE